MTIGRREFTDIIPHTRIPRGCVHLHKQWVDLPRIPQGCVHIHKQWIYKFHECSFPYAERTLGETHPAGLGSQALCPEGLES